MMREIKFRGQIVKSNMFVCGDLMRKEIEFDDAMWEETTFINDITYDYMKSFEVDKATIEQFTGLKDKNGKEIYEGDIIEHYAFIGVVVFEDGMFTTDKSHKQDKFCSCRQPLAYHNTKEMEVIGNIYQNPELISEVNDENK